MTFKSLNRDIIHLAQRNHGISSPRPAGGTDTSPGQAFLPPPYRDAPRSGHKKRRGPKTPSFKRSKDAGLQFGRQFLELGHGEHRAVHADIVAADVAAATDADTALHALFQRGHDVLGLEAQFFQGLQGELAMDGAYGWLSSRALAPDGSDQPMNLQRKTMYRDIDGFDGKEIPSVMASFVSLFLRMDTVRQFGLPIAEFFIWSDDWEYVSALGSIPHFFANQRP